MRTNIGQYRVEAPLGRGGMGVVYRGVHEHLGRQVAIKALAPELTQQPEFRERFFAEAKTQAHLQHPNIVGVYDLLEDGGEYFIVMEFVAGEPLDDRMRATAGKGMEPAEALAVFGQMLSALDYAHSEGVIHRDIKPSNVLITPNGRAKLMDFGIALLVGDKRLTASQSAIGTPIYMSPEQILRPRSVDHRTDIYSAAVVFFEMLAGRPPFDDETEYGIKKLHVEAPPPELKTLRPDLPAGIGEALAVALSKNPDDRFPSAGAFLRAIQTAAPQLQVPAGPTPPPQPIPRPTTLDGTWGTGRAPATAPPPAPTAAPAPSPPPSSPLQGKNRWLVLGVAAVLVLAIGIGGTFLLLRAFGGEETKVAEVTPAAESVPAAPGPVAPSSPPVASPAAGPGVPLVAQSAPAIGQALPAQQAPALQTAPPPQVRPEPPAPRSRKTEAAPAPAPLPAPIQPDPTPAPATPAPAPAPEEAPATSSGATIDRMNQMNDVIVSLERLAEQAQEAYEDENGEGLLATKLDSFLEAAVALRREYRKVTGTGLRGVGENMKGIFRRNRGGREGDTHILEVKAQDLSHKGSEIDGLISSAGPTVQAYWKDVKTNLRKLDAFFR